MKPQMQGLAWRELTLRTAAPLGFVELIGDSELSQTFYLSGSQLTKQLFEFTLSFLSVGFQ